MLATEFKKQIEAMTRGQVQISLCGENKDAVMRPAIDWGTAPDYVKQLIYAYMDTPYEER